MKKIFVQAAFTLFISIALATSGYSRWVQTNWPATSSFFDLYANQGKVFARIWDSNEGGRMYLTGDNGTTWTPIGSAASDMDILSVVVVNNSILAGTWNGFYQSPLTGVNWTAVTLKGVDADTAIPYMAMVGSVLFAGTTTGDIYTSSDGGSNWDWSSVGVPVNARLTSVIASGTTLLAGCANDGVLISYNKGLSWDEFNAGLKDTHIRQLFAAGGQLFAVTSKGLFISDSNTVSWTPDASGLKNVNCLMAMGNRLFAGTDSNGVYLSDDNGRSWSSVSAGLPADSRIWSLVASGDNIFVGTSSGVYRMNPADIQSFTITASASAGGTISPQGSVTVYEDGSQTFTFTPALGYRIGDVVVDGVSKGVAESYTLSRVAANHTISVSFVAVPIYSIIASAGEGGTISPSGTVKVSQTWSQKFAIAASKEYLISSVIVDGVSVGAVTTYTFTNVAADHTISAVFSKVPYTVTASAGTGGTISPSGAVTVLSGSSQTFTITPADGYEIRNVLVDNVAVGAVTSYTLSSVVGNRTISASFNSLSSLVMYRVDCGTSYSAVSPFTRDSSYTGTSAIQSVTNTIDTNGVTDPAPQGVYQTLRRGSSFTYTLSNLTAGASHKVRLHFSENSFAASDKCKFNVAIGGVTVLSSFDIFAETGAQYKAIVKEFTATANTAGQIVISFTAVVDSAKVAGIEIIRQL
jgi:hypothetical protein